MIGSFLVVAMTWITIAVRRLVALGAGIYQVRTDRRPNQVVLLLMLLLVAALYFMARRMM